MILWVRVLRQVHQHEGYVQSHTTARTLQLVLVNVQLITSRILSALSGH
jgi:hypothetical protein